MDPQDETLPAKDEPLTDVEVERVLHVLQDKFPQPRTALRHTNPFELLIATILSAQATDEMVNRVTPSLFERCPTPEALLELDIAELEQAIRTIGLYRSKARNILGTCRTLIAEFGGEVPRTRDELMRLPGVGRKTANVVISNAFDQPAIAVDTHVFRVANRIGLADSDDVRQVEEQLMRRVPRERWTDAHHWLILHGRSTCTARRPACSRCEIVDICRAGRRATGET